MFYLKFFCLQGCLFKEHKQLTLSFLNLKIERNTAFHYMNLEYAVSDDYNK